MKSAPSDIPESLRLEADFGYVAGLPESRKRLAVYYEHWRESDDEHLRTRGVCCGARRHFP
jgi:hypothetical protein